MALTDIPDDFGAGGAGLTPGTGDPDLVSLLQEHHDAIEALQTEAAIVEEVRFATTANINLSTTGLTAIDGVTPVAGDIVLVKDQSTGSQNGIYVASASAWTRKKDANGDDVIHSGMIIEVSEGSVNADKQFVLQTNDPITVGTTSLTFAPSVGTSATASNATPAALGANVVAGSGSGANFSRDDHKHAIFQAPEEVSTSGVHNPSLAAETTVYDLATAAGDVTGTLADGTVPGMHKTLTLGAPSAGKTAKITVTHCNVGTTHEITLTDPGDSACLCWCASQTVWLLINLGGGATIA